jgi:DNA polymerase elongation subunit (family B)
MNTTQYSIQMSSQINKTHSDTIQENIYKAKSTIIKKNKVKLNVKRYYECRLLEFNALDSDEINLEENDNESDESDNEVYSEKKKYVKRAFNIQMFGIDENGRKYSVTAINYCPFFYIKVGEDWNEKKKFELLSYIIDKLPNRNKAGEIKDMNIVKSKKLYGFDNEKLHNFVIIRFTTMSCYYTVKKLWYSSSSSTSCDLLFNNEALSLYEGHIPPLIRMFHINDISPSGWIKILRTDAYEFKGNSKKTTCDYELAVDYNKIESHRNKETPVPYKICSFDIEANSSHGDFPLPVKTYKKLCDQFLELFESIYFKKYNEKHSLINSQENVDDLFNKTTIQLYLELAITKALYHADNFNKKYANKLKNEDTLLKIQLNSVYLKYDVSGIEQSKMNKLKELFNDYIHLFIDKVYLKHKFDSFDNYSNISTHAFDAILKNSDINLGYEKNDDSKITLVNYFKDIKKSYSGNYNDDGEDAEDAEDATCDCEENIDNLDNIEDTKTKQNQAQKPKQRKKIKIIEKITSSIKYDTKQYTLKLDDPQELMHLLDTILNSTLPKVDGDKVTFIGSTFRINGQEKPYLNNCLVLGDCDKVDGSVIQPCPDEKTLLVEWTRLIQKENPDIIIGYNIFGFDYVFMFNRAVENGVDTEFLKLSRNKNESAGKMDYNTKKVNLHQLSIKIASGEYNLYYPQMNGRLQIDLLNYFRRDFNLEMYKLDFTAGYFISDKIKSIEYDTSLNKTKVTSKNLIGLENNSYIKIKETSHSDNYYNDGAKFIVSGLNVSEGCFYLDGKVSPNMKTKVSWCLSKDDVTPQEIFQFTNEGPAKKAIVAKYCIQDCNLVHELLKKIDVITGFVEMANICSVPLSFIVLRGQGIKLTSYVSKKCREKNTLMPTLNKNKTGEGYEGAIVLEPKTNLYLDDPVACVDYSSLYPSSMISENLCHSSKVWTKTYNLKNELIAFSGETDENCNFIYDNLPNMKYVDVEFDTYRYHRKTPKSAAVKIKSGKKVCRFAQYQDKKAILPSVLEELLFQRNATKKLMAKETDPFMKNIYDKRQLSIKVTANSIYGQTGAAVGDFFEPDVAASTTSTGRKLLTYAKRVIEEVYGDNVCETKSHGKVKTRAEYIYGDTDSVFFCFNLQEMDGTPIKGQKALEITIELAKEAGHMATKFLKKPHDLEYEKTFLPFCLLSKKRYVGMLYEDDPAPGACYRKSMGIVLKRRDNAPIVKDVYGGIIDILMKEKSIDKSLDYLNTMLMNMYDGKVALDKLIITKSLRGHYANPNQIAHKVLADRITLRDPGNKPNAGDRIPFVYIESKYKNTLQGDKIELPDYVVQHNLKIDYAHYITNQIMKPILQLYSLVLEKLPAVKTKRTLIQKIEREIETYSHLEHDKYIEKRESIRCKYVQKYLFDDVISLLKVKKSGNKTITSMFNKK